jgi:hypothetical protein
VRRLVLLLVLAAAAPAATAAPRVPQPAHPRALVVLVPGSGFNGAGQANAERMSFKEASWRRWGFRTAIASYRRGRAGLVDVTRRVRSLAHAFPVLPLCVYGESSGGTWALLVAARSGVVDCAVVLAAPTDQETLAASPFGPARHLGGDVWPRYFGSADDDDSYEPLDVWTALRPTVPLFMAYSVGDRIVPVQQGRIFAEAVPGLEIQVLAKGRHQFVHAQVDPSDFVTARRGARALVDAAVFGAR